MNRSVLIALMMLLPLSACHSSHQNQDKLKAPLAKIRVMVKQSVVLASEAACSEGDTRAQLINASVVLLRRAMGGPEMDHIHKMMGKMSDAKATKMSAEMQMHVNLHAAGEDAFDFLDALSQKSSLSCTDVRPLSLAATASLMRESPSQEVNATVKKLDDQADALLKGKVPKAVRTLAQDIKKI